jgi:hypothetical protein
MLVTFLYCINRRERDEFRYSDCNWFFGTLEALIGTSNAKVMETRHLELIGSFNKSTFFHLQFFFLLPHFPLLSVLNLSNRIGSVTPSKLKWPLWNAGWLWLAASEVKMYSSFSLLITNCFKS